MHDGAAAARLAEAGAVIITRVAAALPVWVEDRVAWIADAWGRLGPTERAALDARARDAAATSTARVVEELTRLFAAAAADQRSTPLEVVRSAARDVGAVLAEAGIPPVARDEFHERSFPDDPYGVTPASLADLGDPDLGPWQLAWGLAKAQVLRAGG